MSMTAGSQKLSLKQHFKNSLVSMAPHAKLIFTFNFPLKEATFKK
jgi:hypothetical protein